MHWSMQLACPDMQPPPPPPFPLPPPSPYAFWAPFSAHTCAWDEVRAATLPYL